MRNLYLFLFCISLNLYSASSQSVNFDWAVGIGGTSLDNGFNLTVDQNGSTYVTGGFQGTADFNPGPQEMNLTSNGSNDIFLLKLDASGNYEWAFSIGGSSNDNGVFVYVDANSDIYLTGSFQGNVDFDPGAGVSNFTSNGSNDFFLAKFNSDGDLLWVNALGQSSDDRGNCLSVDVSGNIILTGKFQGIVDFNPGSGVANLSSNGSADIYLASYDTDGNYLWAKSFGGTGDDEAYSLVLDNDDNILITGAFETTVDFDPGSGSSIISSSGSKDIFFAKYSNVGNHIWSKYLSGTDGSLGSSIEVDALGNCFLSGTFSAAIDIDPSSGVENLITNGGFDIYLLKYNSDGTLIWGNGIGGASFDSEGGLALDSEGNPHLTGYFKGTVDFDAGPGVSNLVSNTNNDVFVTKYRNDGTYAWSFGFGGNDLDNGYDIEVDINSNVYVTGTFQSTADFDPGTASFTLNSNGSFDFYVSKFGASDCEPTAGADLQTACGSYTWIDGNTYSQSNNTAIYTISGGASNGCDSIITLNLTILEPATGIDNQTACNSFTWIDGNTYTESNNTVSFTISGGAISGCDSVVTLNLTILEPSSSIDNQTACDFFTWIDGNTYNESNSTAIFIISSGAANGCDSILTLNLIINTVNTNTTLIGNVITSEASDASYQWLDCDDGFSIISDETAASFNVVMLGEYAVEVSQNGCVDTSSCISISTVGVDEADARNSIEVFPNPTTGILFLSMKEFNDLVTINIFSTSGKLMNRMTFENLSLIQIEFNQPKGVYLLEIIDKQGVRSYNRVIKN